MIETALANPELSELESIFSSIETASKTISNLVRRSSLTGLTGYLDSGNINIQGEEQKKLDVITNDVLKNALRYTGRMGVLASEEEDAPVEVDDDIEEKYQKEVLVEKTRGEFATTLETRMCLCCCARVPSPCSVSGAASMALSPRRRGAVRVDAVDATSFLRRRRLDGVEVSRPSETARET